MRPSYASALSRGFALLISPPPIFKGLITDLDDTLWRGIVGDDGVDGVSWALDGGTHNHALYQQLLESLSASGVLLAVASKNDAAIAAQGLARSDLLVPGAAFFPVETGWSAKSRMVRRILQSWNIGEDAVVFVDDNPMELAEIQAEFPSMRCLQFPTRDYEGSYRLLREIRDLFGKFEITDEDRLRSQSIARSSAIEEAGETDVESFLQQLDATVDLRFGGDASDPRPLQLLNKTNQFNMNGLRVGDSNWLKLLEDSGAVVLVASYTDKFGPLGKVSVAAGEIDGTMLRLRHWVLSCRAFARRIEFRMLDVLFRTLGVDSIQLDYAVTERNKAFAHFLTAFASPAPEGLVVITRQKFDAVCPKLYERFNVYGR
jgi:FkbH-like protein